MELDYLTTIQNTVHCATWITYEGPKVDDLECDSISLVFYHSVPSISHLVYYKQHILRRSDILHIARHIVVWSGGCYILVESSGLFGFEFDRCLVLHKKHTCNTTFMKMNLFPTAYEFMKVFTHLAIAES